jgi:hypothetical protein
LGRLLGPDIRRVAGGAALVLACSVGLAMVALQLHRMSDFVAGVPLGLAIAGCSAWSLDVIGGRFALAYEGRARSAETVPPDLPR